MSNLIWAIDMGKAVGGAGPTVSNVVVTQTNAGACPAHGSMPTQAAQITITWTTTNANPANYRTDLYVNGSLSMSNATSPVIVSFPGYVDQMGTPLLHVQQTYTPKVFLLATGALVSQASSALYDHVYGTCNGPQ